MDEFFRTVMGRKYFEVTLPELVKGINRLAAAQEKQNEIVEKQQAIITEDMKREAERDKHLFGESVSAEWVLNSLAGHSFPSSGAAYDYLKNLLDKERVR